MAKNILALLIIVATAIGADAHAYAQSEVTIAIGTTNAVTNTVNAGAIVRELKLFEKYLPTDGKYADVKFKLDWQNFTSGPPQTNAMMAGRLQFGSMADYPLVVNAATFANNPDSKSRLIVVTAYNLFGSGNGLVVNKDSPYFQLSDLKGKLVSVPFGSAAHGMVLKALQDRGWPTDYFQLANQAPEVGSANLEAKNIDGHADFVPFAEWLPFRGFARKIFDGAETNVPTFHGVIARTDFAEKYPEVVAAYIKAIIAANAWVRADPKGAAEKIQQWTGVNKEVVYLFLGPGGIMTMDPTIKPALIKATALDQKVLQGLGLMKDFNVDFLADDTYVRLAFTELGLNYDEQRASTENYEIKGYDSFCKRPITEPRNAGEVWVDGEGINSFSSAACTLGGLADFNAKGKKIDVVYVFDTPRHIKLFADKAFYAIASVGGKTEIAPFLLKADAEAYAEKAGGKVVDFERAIKVAPHGG